MNQCAAQMGVPPPTLTPESTAALETYPFPGNVRELIHIIEGAVIVSEGAEIQPKHLSFEPPHLDVPSSPVTPIDESSPLNAADSVPQDMRAAPFLPLNEALARYERQYLCQVLDWTGGNRAEAARLLNIPRRTFYRKLAKYNL